MIIVEDIYIKAAGYTDEEMKIENVLNAFFCTGKVVVAETSFYGNSALD